VDAGIDEGLLIVDGAALDLGAAVSAKALAAAVSAAAERDDVDALVVVYAPSVATQGHRHAAALHEAVMKARVPVVTTFLAVDGLLQHLVVRSDDGSAGRGSLPSFRTPERAVAALAHAVRYGGWLARPPGTIPELSGIDTAAARGAINRMRGHDDRERATTDIEVVSLLHCYGIDIAAFKAIGSVEDALAAAEEIGYPVALKSFDQALRHRLDQSGIRLGVESADQLRREYDNLLTIAGPWLYVQKQVPRDHAEVPTVFRITADPSFGALISFGIGGVATELLDDRAYRAVPLTDADAADLIDAPRASPLLNGYRGTRVVPRGPLIDLALRLSVMADDLPELMQLQLQPVLAGPAGVMVTGATARIGPPAAQPDVRRRLL